LISENEIPKLSGTFPEALQDFSGTHAGNYLSLLLKTWRKTYEMVSIFSAAFDISIHFLNQELLHVGKVKRRIAGRPKKGGKVIAIQWEENVTKRAIIGRLTGIPKFNLTLAIEI